VAQSLQTGAMSLHAPPHAVNTSETLFATRTELITLPFDDKLTKMLIEQGVRVKMNSLMR